MTAKIIPLYPRAMARNLIDGSTSNLTIDHIGITDGPNRDELFRIFKHQYDRRTEFNRFFYGIVSLNDKSRFRVFFAMAEISHLSHSVDKTGDSFQFQVVIERINIAGIHKINLIADDNKFKAHVIYDTHRKIGETLEVS